MDGKRTALALLLAFIVACGGAPASTSSSAPAASAAQTAAAATSAAAAATSSANSGAADASAQLAATLGLAKNATYKITYKISATGSGADAFNGEQTWWVKPPRTRFDFVLSQGGQKLTIQYFSLPEGTFSCVNVGIVQCTTVAGTTGSPIDQNPAVSAQQSLIGNPTNFSASASGSKTLAGQTASCYDVKSKASGTGFDSGTFCYSKDGVPLLSTFTITQPQSLSLTMEATNFSTTVADGDFTLPAKPIGR